MYSIECSEGGAPDISKDWNINHVTSITIVLVTIR
jgi:hypothetical protein